MCAAGSTVSSFGSLYHLDRRAYVVARPVVFELTMGVRHLALQPWSACSMSRKGSSVPELSRQSAIEITRRILVRLCRWARRTAAPVHRNGTVNLRRANGDRTSELSPGGCSSGKRPFAVHEGGVSS